MSTGALDTGLLEAGHSYDPASPLRPTGNLRRRERISAVVAALATTAAYGAVLVLVLVAWEVLHEGAGQVFPHFPRFLSHNPPQFGGPGGGIFSAIVGSILITAVGAFIAIPVGILTAIYLTEFARPTSRVAALMRLGLNLLQGMPTIVIGLFVFGLMVENRHESGFAGSVALSLVMVPLIARASQEVLLVVPGTLREAADSLGVDRWRTVLGVILPSASGGIVTGIILAVARAAGETAPLLIVDSLFTSQPNFDLFGQSVPNIPVLILTNAESADPTGFARAWGAALVLLAVILAANVAARLLLTRSRRRMGI